MPSRSLATARRLAARLRRPTSNVVSAIAERVVAAQRRLRPRDVQRKGVGDFVTSVDVVCERTLRAALRTLLPEAGFLGEETAAAELDRDFVWVVDPIDGTSNYLHGGDRWCVAGALAEGGRPVVAAVYRPVGEELFTAIAGHGAWLNGKRVRVSEGDSLSGARFMGNRKSLGPLEDAGIQPIVDGTLPLQLRLAYVAAGRLDGAVSVGARHDWDLAAGDLLVHEAGGVAGDTTGKVYVYNRQQTWQQGLVAANATRHSLTLHALGTS